MYVSLGRDLDQQALQKRLNELTKVISGVEHNSARVWALEASSW